MKQQLLEKRQILIEHLESKIKALREERDLLFRPDTEFRQADSHVNIQSYLNKQPSFPEKQQKTSLNNIKKAQSIQNCNIPTAPNYSRADMIRQQKETKQKIQKLGDLYNKKKQLEIIGVQENNADKINHLFNKSQSKKQIDKKMEQTKVNKLKQQEKDRIIQQELANAKAFLKGSKISKINSNYVPQKHYTKIFATDQKKLGKITSLLKKNNLSLVEKDDILWEIFQVLREKNALDKITTKETLRQFLMSNIQICDLFYLTKNEIMRDLQVYQTKQPNILTYRQFYEFIKSIEITNLALKPNLKFKNKKEDVTITTKAAKVENDQKVQKSKEIESYLKRLYNYLDSKHEKVIQRNKLEAALKKGLLFDDKKYRSLTKKEIEQFGHSVERTRQKYKDRDYYKNLDLKYIGLEQILNLHKQAMNSTLVDVQQHVQNSISKESNGTNEQHVQIEDQNTNEEEYIEMLKCDLRPELQKKDFQRYGWEEKEENEQKFKSIRELDKHYGQLKQKYGNEIAWNGFQHYREDFSKFNECIKELNSKNERETKK